MFDKYMWLTITAVASIFSLAMAILYGQIILYGLAIIAALLAVRFCVLPIIKQSVEIVDRVVDIQVKIAERKTVAVVLAESLDRASRSGATYNFAHDTSSLKVLHALPTANVKVEEVVNSEESQQKQLPAPKMYKLIDQIHNGDTLPGEEISTIGYTSDGQPVRGKLFDIQENIYNSIFTVGDQGYGKTAFAVLMAAYTVQHGGRLLVIDPEKGMKQSLTERLGPLVNPAFMLCEVADTPQKAERLLDIAESEIENPSDFPVLLLVDELSMIARQAEAGMGQWKDAGKRILSVAEDYATRGRKRIRRVIVMGQFTQGKRNGGTTLRYAMALMCFKIDKKQSQLALDLEDAVQTPTLRKGEVMVIPSNSSEPKVRMQVTFPDEEALQVIASTMLDVLESDSGSFHEAETEKLSEPETDSKQSRNILEITPEAAWKAKVRRVREMRKQNKNQRDILYAVWGVMPGGSAEYAKARDEYQSIIKQIAVEDTKEAENAVNQ